MRLARAMAVAVGFLLLTAACGRARVVPVEPPRPLRQASVDEVVAAYDRFCRSRDTLSASGDLDVRDLKAGRARKLSVRLVATRGGRLYLKGSVAVVTALEVVSDGRTFWLQVPSKKTVWTGSAALVPHDAGDDAPYYVLRPADLTAGLLPEPLEPADDETLALASDRHAFVLTVSGRGPRAVVRRSVWLDRETLRPLRLRAHDERGDVVREVAFEAWAADAPGVLRVARPNEGYEALFSFEKQEANVAVPERAFAPRPTPEGYKVVEVG